MASNILHEWHCAECNTKLVLKEFINAPKNYIFRLITESDILMVVSRRL